MTKSLIPIPFCNPNEEILVQAAFYATFSGTGGLSLLVTPDDFLWSQGGYVATTALTVAGPYLVSVRYVFKKLVWSGQLGLESEARGIGGVPNHQEITMKPWEP
jgi:hypothetical protein